MMPKSRVWRLGLPVMIAGLVASMGAVGQTPTEPSKPIARVELAKLFGTRSPWRLVAFQGPGVEDFGDNPAPGALRLCFQKSPGQTCDEGASAMPPPLPGTASDGWEPHYLTDSRPVYPRGRRSPPLLLITTASLHAGDGGQLVATQLFAYRAGADRFERVFAFSTGTNNNEEVRFIPTGPLRGDVILAEPTSHAPYVYWVEVQRAGPDGAYRRVLRYRSATRYGDGNSLAVIDSEMPNIQRRLGMWKPGAPLPTPSDGAKPCARPHMKNGALWCE